MTGIHARFGTPIWVGRTAVEVTVLAIGWVLGGNVGLGTVAFALLIGPLCSITLPLFDRSRRAGQRATAPDRNSERPAAPAAEESLPA
jgi:uncharacterized membrane protein YczE